VADQHKEKRVKMEIIPLGVRPINRTCSLKVVDIGSGQVGQINILEGFTQKSVLTGKQNLNQTCITKDENSPNELDDKGGWVDAKSKPWTTWSLVPSLSDAKSSSSCPQRKRKCSPTKSRTEGESGGKRYFGGLW